MKPKHPIDILLDSFETQARPLIRTCFTPEDDKHLWTSVSGVAKDPYDHGYTRPNPISHLVPHHVAVVYGNETLDSWVGKQQYTPKNAHETIKEAARDNRRKASIITLKEKLVALPAYQCLRAHGLQNFSLAISLIGTTKLSFCLTERESFRMLPGILSK